MLDWARKICCKVSNLFESRRLLRAEKVVEKRIAEEKALRLKKYLERTSRKRWNRKMFNRIRRRQRYMARLARHFGEFDLNAFFIKRK